MALWVLRRQGRCFSDGTTDEGVLEELGDEIIGTVESENEPVDELLALVRADVEREFPNCEIYVQDDFERYFAQITMGSCSSWYYQYELEVYR